MAGLVRENEYMIPEWMRQDPQVVQVEQWLEQKGQRGFREGGSTSEESPVPANTVASNPEVATQLLTVLGRLDSHLQGMEEWQRTFGVHLDVYGLEQTLQE